MNREIIINELNNRGFIAESHDTIKNGVSFEGIIVRTKGSLIAPVIYTDDLILRGETEGLSLDEVVEHIINICSSHKGEGFNLSEIMSRDFILSHIRIGVQKESDEELIKGASELEGIESYLYICGDTTEEGNFSIKVSEAYLKNANITVSEAWEYAKKNTFADTKIESLAKVMADMMGFEYDESMDAQMPLYVLSNSSKIKGASSICDRESLSAFAKEHGTVKLLALPSSVHEMIILPFFDDMDISMYSEMVSQVNSTDVVEPQDRLTDRAYILTF